MIKKAQENIITVGIINVFAYTCLGVLPKRTLRMKNITKGASCNSAEAAPARPVVTVYVRKKIDALGRFIAKASTAEDGLFNI